MTKINDDLKRMFLELLGELLDEALAERQSRAKEPAHPEADLPVMPEVPRGELRDTPAADRKSPASESPVPVPPPVLQSSQTEPPPPPQFSRPVRFDVPLAVSSVTGSPARPADTAVPVEPAHSAAVPAPPFLVSESNRQQVPQSPRLIVPAMPPPPDVTYVGEDETDRQGRYEKDIEDLGESGGRTDKALHDTMQSITRTMGRLAQDLLDARRRVEAIESQYTRDSSPL
jgi:hypothetical protein